MLETIADKLEKQRDKRFLSFDELISMDTGRQVTLSTLAKIELSRAKTAKSQAHAERLAEPLGIQLRKPTDMFRKDLITGELTPIYALARTNLNPEFNKQQARKRHREYNHHYEQTPGKRLFFVISSLDGRVSAEDEYREGLKDSNGSLSRILRQMSEEYPDNFKPEISTTERTHSGGTLYFHYNVVVHMPEKPLYNTRFKYRIKEHDPRNSLVWGQSGISYAHRNLGLGQMIERFRTLVMRHFGYFAWNGVVKNIDSCVEYVTKGDDYDETMTEEMFASIMHQTGGLRLYRPMGDFKEHLRRLKEAKHTVIERAGRVYLREIQDGDYGETIVEERLEITPNDKNDKQVKIENQIISRQSPYFYSTRYKTPGILVRGYTETPSTKRGISNLLVMNEWSRKAIEAFKKNSGNVDIDYAISEGQALEVLLHTTTRQNVLENYSISDEITSLAFQIYDANKLSKSKVEPGYPDCPEYDPDTDEIFENYSEGTQNHPRFLDAFSGM